MALPTVLLKAKNAISKGTQAVKKVKSATSNSNEEEVKSFLGIFKFPILLGAPIVIFVLIVFIMIIAVPQVLYAAVFDSGSDSNNNGSSYSGDIGYIQWAVDIANDDSHGYSQCSRNGPDYDCSSLVYYSLLNSGYTEAQLGSYPFNTRSEHQVLTGIGFVRHNYVESELQPGDILWRSGHTGMYVGDGQIVQASISETGGVCGRTGDQTGQEVWVSQNAGGWAYYYRKEG